MAITTRNRILTIVLTLLLFVTFLFGQGNLPVSYLVAHAATTDSFDDTNVLDDLIASDTFNIKDYPFRNGVNPQIINFVEYCYSYRKNMQDNYGLYIYIYNPSNIDVDLTSYQNKVQMAVSYNSDGTPDRYEKFRLELCNAVTGGDYKNLFYKFKVVEREINGTYFSDRVNSNERRYDISGIELLTRGEQNATEYHVGGTYKFSGYVAGYGPDLTAESTLTSSVETLETLQLNVKHTNFRTNVSSLGPDHYNEVNTAYFSVPERIYDEYGYLQKIRAEWWEYKTKMATITSNQDFYNQLLDYVGVDVGRYDSSVPVYVYSGYSATVNPGLAMHYFDWTYNIDLETKYNKFGSPTSISYCNHVSTIMPYAFYAPSVDVDQVFDFLYTDPVAGDVDSTVLKEWIYSYKNRLGHGYLDVNGRRISKDLFEDFVDEGRTMGYNDKTIDLSDTFDLNSYDSNHNWWDKLWDYGFSWPKTDGDYANVPPIYEVKSSDLSGSDEDISSRLLVNKNDVADLKAYYAAEKLKGNRVVLFRFANTDYYSAKAFTSGGSTAVQCDTYVAQQTVFFDFDIIELTFNKDGVYHVIPVVSSPMDIVNDFTPPATEFQWWKILLAVVMLILLIVLLYPILPYVLKGIWWLICLPFKAIAALIRSIKKKRKKQDDFNKEE